MYTHNVKLTNLRSRPHTSITTTLKVAGTALLMATLIGCGSDDDSDNDSVVTGPDGQVSVVSAAGVTETISAVETAVNNNPNIIFIGRLDHQANAQRVNLALGPNEVIFFGNPNLGTPLMQQNQLAGIDLPQKIHAWENGFGDVEVTYNGASYLQQRHGLNADTPELTTIGNALKGLAETASGGTIDESTIVPSSVSAGDGIVEVASTRSMSETYAALIAAINDNEGLGIFREINHGANAANANLVLGPTQLVIFGNPNAGTPLMVSQPSAGIDLPLKALVYEDADQNVFVAYNNPAYIAERHGITDQAGLIANITTTVAGLVAAATGN